MSGILDAASQVGRGARPFKQKVYSYLNMKVVFDKMGMVLKRNFVSLLVFELIFRIGTWLAVLPGAAILLRWSMRVQKMKFITNQNIFRFLAHPLTILLLALMVFVIIVLCMWEYGALLVCFEYSANNMKINSWEMFLEGLVLLRRLHGRVRTFALVTACLPAINLLMLAAGVVKVQASNYVAERIAMSRGGIPILISVAVLLCILLFVFGLSMAIRFLRQDLGDKEKIAIFHEYHRGRFLKNVSYILLWNLAAVGILLLFSAVLICVVSIYIALTPGSGYTMLRIIEHGNRVFLCIGFLAGFISTTVNLSGLYCLAHVLEEQKVGKNEMKKRFAEKTKILQLLHKRVALAVVVAVGILELHMVVRSYITGDYNISDVMTGVAVTAHRGASKDAPENTLEALQLAIDQYADYAEVDVQESADGVLFLLHDMSTLRTGNKAVVAYTQTYEELQKIDVSAKKKGYSDVRIPTLEDAILLCRGQIKLNIEIKTNAKTPDVVDKTVAMIEDLDFVNQCVVTCTDLNYLARVKELNPDIMTGQILKVTIGDVPQSDALDFLSMKYTNVTASLVERAHELGMEVHVWTVNDTNSLKEMTAIGVDNIITDDAPKAKQIIHGERLGEGLLSILRSMVKQVEK
jgi:glycerophosphoryl diester phosphodiesterase